MANPSGPTSDPSAQLAALRHEYAAGGLAESDLADDPIAMFRRWFDEASDAGLAEPNAMVVATVSAGGRPSARTVLLKGVGVDGFRFCMRLDRQFGGGLSWIWKGYCSHLGGDGFRQCIHEGAKVS